MERVILHSDANCFYASVESVYRPELRRVPMAVCGDPEARHGIVLTKNYLAKKYGVSTGEAIWQAKQKCPNLVVVPPNFPLYMEYSRRLRKLYEEYTDRVEAFGLDESWLDISQPSFTIADGERLANEIRRRVRKELEITVSVGVSFNKVFAKLGSDMKKPDGTTVIRRDNFRKIVWPLAARDLLYVGPKTERKLREMGIYTIGDLARANTDVLSGRLGKNGRMLQSYALGLDLTPVSPSTADVAAKSISNSTTLPRDLNCLDDARCVLYLLAESVGARLRKLGLRAGCVSVFARDTTLHTDSCQRSLSASTNITGEIARASVALFVERLAYMLPLRSVGIGLSGLESANAPVQLDMFGQYQHRMREERLDQTLDVLNARYGRRVVRRGIVFAEQDFCRIQPSEKSLMNPFAHAGQGNSPEHSRKATDLS